MTSPTSSVYELIVSSTEITLVWNDNGPVSLIRGNGASAQALLVRK